MNNFNIFNNSGLLYLISNILALLAIIIIFLVSSFIQKKQIKNINNHIISIIAMLLAFSVVINHFVNQIFYFKFKIADLYRFQFRVEFKDIILFVIGMVYGPFFGFTAGFCNDIIGLIIKFKGSFHLGFTLGDILYGFIGGLVFLFNKKKRWFLKTILIFSLFFIFHSLLLKPLFLYCAGWHKISIIKDFIVRLIKLPFVILLYNFTVILLFKIIYKIILIRYNQNVWVLRHGKIIFKKKQINLF